MTKSQRDSSPTDLVDVHQRHPGPEFCPASVTGKYISSPSLLRTSRSTGSPSPGSLNSPEKTRSPPSTWHSPISARPGAAAAPTALPPRAYRHQPHARPALRRGHRGGSRRSRAPCLHPSPGRATVPADPSARAGRAARESSPPGRTRTEGYRARPPHPPSSSSTLAHVGRRARPTAATRSSVRRSCSHTCAPVPPQRPTRRTGRRSSGPCRRARRRATPAPTSRADGLELRRHLRQGAWAWPDAGRTSACAAAPGG